MRIGLLIPCFIDEFPRRLGSATLELLKRFGHEVVYRGRPDLMRAAYGLITVLQHRCASTEALFVRNFAGFDYVVAPQGSCVDHVRSNFDAIKHIEQVKEKVRAHAFELVEFLDDVRRSKRSHRGGFASASASTTNALRCAG